MFNMLSLIKGKNNKICVNVLIHKRKMSGIIPKAENGEISEELPARRADFCNKSGLLNHHRNVLHNIKPYREPNSWIHLTEKYQRKMFGRYGSESGVSASICFSKKADGSLKSNYEKLSEANPLHSMINKYKLDQNNKNNQIVKREEDIRNKIDRLNQWKQELHAKTLKKEADAIAAKKRKDRLVEEVRRHFGYLIDPRDERFKEMLAQKEREDKKKQREAKRKDNEQKLMSKLAEKSVTT